MARWRAVAREGFMRRTEVSLAAMAGGCKEEWARSCRTFGNTSCITPGVGFGGGCVSPGWDSLPTDGSGEGFAGVSLSLSILILSTLIGSPWVVHGVPTGSPWDSHGLAMG